MLTGEMVEELERRRPDFLGAHAVQDLTGVFEVARGRAGDGHGAGGGLTQRTGGRTVGDLACGDGEIEIV